MVVMNVKRGFCHHCFLRPSGFHAACYDICISSCFDQWSWIDSIGRFFI